MVVKFPNTYEQKTIGGSLLPTIEDCPRRAFIKRFRGSLTSQYPFLHKTTKTLTLLTRQDDLIDIDTECSQCSCEIAAFEPHYLEGGDLSWCIECGNKELRIYNDSVAQRIGKAIHKTIEHGLKHKLIHTTVPSITTLLTVATDTYLHDNTTSDDTPNVDIEYDGGKSALWCHRNKDGALAFISKAMNEVVAVIEKIEPASIEEEFIVEPQWLQGWQLVVHPDVLDTQGVCHDVKTMKAGGNPSYQSQLGLYAIALSESGYGINGLCVDAIEKGGKTTEQSPAKTFHYPVQASADHAADLITDFTQRVDHYFNVDPDIRTFKANTQSNLCSKRFCPAFDTNLCPVTQQPQP
jgi:hypothetical protein